MNQAAGCYVIASTPRTGSYLLCESLTATGIAGVPTEPFNPQFLNVFRRMWGLPDDVRFDEYVRAVARNGTTGNGVFGVKLHWNQAEWLVREQAGRLSSDDLLERLFPGAKYIQMIRRDRRGQAISFYRAQASNEWWRIAGVVNRQVTGCDPVFDGRAIRRLEDEIERQETAWRTSWVRRGIVPLILEYESLVQYRCKTLARVLDFLEQDPAAAFTIPQPRLLRQADSTTEEWRRLLDAEDAPVAAGR